MLKHIKKLLGVDHSERNPGRDFRWRMEFAVSCKAVEVLTGEVEAAMHDVVNGPSSEKAPVTLREAIERLSSIYKSIWEMPEPRQQELREAKQFYIEGLESFIMNGKCFLEWHKTKDNDYLVACKISMEEAIAKIKQALDLLQK